MRITLITPTPKHSRTGNRITALRWARMLRKLDHKVNIETEFNGTQSDVMIALHARRSHSSIVRFRQLNSTKPLIVALTGTDLYHDLPRSRDAQKSLEWADRLVVLQPLAIEELPEEFRSKTRTIYQSAIKQDRRIKKKVKTFDVCVLGHLRPVKDPFRAALGARSLPKPSRIRVLQIGAALGPEMEQTALAEMTTNPRYRWLGEKPRWQARRILASCRLLVLSSQMEGGANVISEAVVAGVPILASNISGSVGLLGKDYPGYFSVGNTDQLRELLLRAESQGEFLFELQAWGERLQHLFEPEAERNAWGNLLDELCVSLN